MVWVAVGVGVYLAALLGLSWVSLHPPRTPIFLSPGAMGAPQEDVSFASSDGTILRGWWMPAGDQRHVAVLCHGYLMCRSELTALAFRLWREGCSCLVFDFRAHGHSGGKRTTLGLVEREDVKAAVVLARQLRPGATVALLGSSMGAAAAALAMADDPDLADALVMDSSFGRLSSAIQGWWRFLGGKPLAFILWPCTVIATPLAGFLPHSVDVARALGKLDGREVLLVHGSRDILALPREAERNAKACTPPAEIVWLPDMSHSEGRWLMPGEYEQAVLRFLRARACLDEAGP